MDFFKELKKERDEQTKKGLVLSKVTLFKLLSYNKSILLLQEKELKNIILTNKEEIKKDSSICSSVLESLSFLIEAKKFEKEEEKQAFLISLKPILLELVNQEIVTKCKEQISSLFKNYFKFELFSFNF